MAYKLVCVNPFGDYAKGQEVTDKGEVERLLNDREQYFVRVAMPEEEAQPAHQQEAPKPSRRG